jgi:hypothetical protein
MPRSRGRNRPQARRTSAIRRLAAPESVRESGSALREGGLALARLLGGALQEIGRAVVATGDALGRIELHVARLLSGPLLALVRTTRATIRTAARVITPRRAVAVVILCAAVLLGVSQFVDYRGVQIGAPLYEGVEAVAPPPQTDREPAGSAHAYALLPVAILAIGALAFALRGRWQLGRAVSLLGIAGIAVTLLIDRPRGLDEGSAALDFEGAHAVLVEGFWVQLSASAVLLVAGVLLGRYVRAEKQPAAGRTRRGAARGRRRRATSAAEVRA